MSSWSEKTLEKSSNLSELFLSSPVHSNILLISPLISDAVNFVLAISIIDLKQSKNIPYMTKQVIFIMDLMQGIMPLP